MKRKQLIYLQQQNASHATKLNSNNFIMILLHLTNFIERIGIIFFHSTLYSHSNSFLLFRFYYLSKKEKIISTFFPFYIHFFLLEISKMSKIIQHFHPTQYERSENNLLSYQYIKIYSQKDMKISFCKLLVIQIVITQLENTRYPDSENEVTKQEKQKCSKKKKKKN